MRQASMERKFTNLESFSSMAACDLLRKGISMNQAINKVYYLTRQYEKCTRKQVRLEVEKEYKLMTDAFKGYEYQLEKRG